MTFEQEIREAEGRAKAEGIIIGKTEGKMEEKVEMVKEMLRDGASIDKMLKYTKLPIDKIKEISNQIGVKLVE